MKFKRTFRKKRTYRKRKAFRKKGYRKSNYDRGIALKCHVVDDMLYYGAFGHADFSVDWGSGAVSGVNSTARLSTS